MTIAFAMTRDVYTIAPTASTGEAAHIMRAQRIGMLPVVDAGRLAGVITDRDIALSAFVDGTHSGTPVFRLMRDAAQVCSENEEIEAVLARMAAYRAYRMPVCDTKGRVVGVVTLGDIAQCAPQTEGLIQTLAEVSHRTGFV